MHRERDGVLLCLLSAAGFGAMAILAKLAYRAGFDVGSLLAARFGLAALALWAIVAVRRPGLPSRRTVVAAVGLGAVGYAAQSSAFLASLQYIDASLASLLLYVYPVLVFVGALALRRESATRRRVGALALASLGTILVLAGGGPGALDPTGVALALTAAIAYSGYVLIADRSVGDADPYMLSALVTSAAAFSVWTFTLASGGPHFAHVEAGGWLTIAAIALASTVMPITAFLLGLDRVGPSTASIVSTVEPVITVVLAMLVFGERLGAVQAVGGACVIGAVLLLQWRARRTPREPLDALAVRAASVRIRGASAESPGLPAAGPVARQPA